MLFFLFPIEYFFKYFFEYLFINNICDVLPQVDEDAFEARHEVLYEIRSAYSKVWPILLPHEHVKSIASAISHTQT